MIVLFLVAVCVILIYRYTTRNHDYWAKRNVKHDPPLPFFGNHLQNFLIRRTAPEVARELYNKYKGEKVVGYYRGTIPEIIIRDPEIVKHILTVDYKNFPDRGASQYIKNDPLLHNIVFLTGERWRVMRQQMIPGFSRSKLRDMFPLQLECMEKLENKVEAIASRGAVVKGYDLMVGYTLQCIGSCGFGVETNTISSEHSEFKNIAKKFFIKTKPQMLGIALFELLPDVALMLTHKLVHKDLETLIIEMTRRVRDERRSEPSSRKDFVSILLEMEAQRRKEKSLEGNPEESDEESLQYAAAQLCLLLIGGFETTATAMSATLHYLAHYPQIQVKVQQDIDRVLSQFDNTFTFECLDEMTQLEMAFKESMRLLAPFGTFRRSCAERYTIPGTDVTIDPMVRVVIPTQALHMDPEYFENPEEFRPERFASDGGKQAPTYKYLAFGEGPRKCIGNRLALMMGIAGLAVILRRFTVAPAPQSKYQLSVKKTSHLVQVAEGGLPITFVRR